MGIFHVFKLYEWYQIAQCSIFSETIFMYLLRHEFLQDRENEKIREKCPNWVEKQLNAQSASQKLCEQKSKMKSPAVLLSLYLVSNMLFSKNKFFLISRPSLLQSSSTLCLFLQFQRLSYTNMKLLPCLKFLMIGLCQKLAFKKFSFLS